LAVEVAQNSPTLAQITACLVVLVAVAVVLIMETPQALVVLVLLVKALRVALVFP
jgi:hypothetical protein